MFTKAYAYHWTGGLPWEGSYVLRYWKKTGQCVYRTWPGREEYRLLRFCRMLAGNGFIDLTAQQ